jgi:mannose-6-phosphate isomerase-like protein (cupin superfamily)
VASETFVVLTGEIRIDVGDEQTFAGPGTVALLRAKSRTRSSW